MTAQDAPTASLDAVDIESLRSRWSRLAGEVGRDLAADNALNVAKRMEQLDHLEAYIALVEEHRHARRPTWRRWASWRRIILILAVLATLGLLLLAFTQPSRAEARFDLRASSVVFTTQGDVRLALGRRFETISVTGLERLAFPDAGGERVINGRELIVSSDRGSGGRLDWIYISGGSTVRLQASGREISVRISAEPRRGEATPSNALPAVRFALNPGSHISVNSALNEFSEEHIAVGVGDSAAGVEGLCPTLPARIEASIVLAPDEPLGDGVRLSRLSGVDISRLACTNDDLVSGERRSTLLAGEVVFPEIEVPHVELDEGTMLSIRDLDGTLVRVELGPDGVHAVAQGEVGGVLAGRDGDCSLLPSRLEHLFARRFRMYTAGVLLYAFVFIVALLKGEKASIGEGFRPHSLMGMVRGGGHL